MPLARDVVKDLAVEHGACIRPIQLRRTDLATGRTEPVLVPCGHTLASVCPSCADRAKSLRAVQCREGWHLDREPIVQAEDDEAIEDLDEQITRSGMRGNVLPARPVRRHRSTRRRQDTPDLPRRKIT